MSAMYQTFQNTPIFQTAWRGFLGSRWTDEVNVRDFIQNNYTQYDGDERARKGRCARMRN